jgi:Topoisomerase 6 subunit A/Spo11, Toprim domain
MPRVSMKALLWRLIPEGAKEAGGSYPVFSQRDLYYKVRDKYLEHPERPYHREYMLKCYKDETDEQYEARREAARRRRGPIDYGYFKSKVLKPYEREHGPIEGMIREAYGKFVEPHSGESFELGTLEVASYTFPPHSFDKILVVEKLTERNKFEHDRIAEKYDMAILYSRGYATEALHELLSVAEEGEYQVFIWHDADVDGYNIFRNIRQATPNMPRAIEVIDIGLTVEEAIRIGCSSEPFESDEALPHELRPLLNDVELKYFEEKQIRFEINGIEADERMAYVEEQLRAHGIRPKYVPPEDELEELVAQEFEREMEFRVGMVIDRLVDKRAIVTTVTEEMRERLQLEDAEPFIRERFEERPTASWSGVVDAEHRRRARAAREEIEDLVRETLVTTVTEEQDEDGEKDG